PPVRAARRRSVHGEHRGHQQPPRRVDRAVDADRDRLATVPTVRTGPERAARPPAGGVVDVGYRPITDGNPTPGGPNRGGWVGTAGVVVAAAVPLAFLAVCLAYPGPAPVARGSV